MISGTGSTVKNGKFRKILLYTEILKNDVLVLSNNSLVLRNILTFLVQTEILEVFIDGTSQVLFG